MCSTPLQATISLPTSDALTRGRVSSRRRPRRSRRAGASPRPARPPSTGRRRPARAGPPRSARGRAPHGTRSSSPSTGRRPGARRAPLQRFEPGPPANDAIASFVGAKNVSRSSRALSASRTADKSRVASESRLREGCVSTISIRVEHSFSFPGRFLLPRPRPGLPVLEVRLGVGGRGAHRPPSRGGLRGARRLHQAARQPAVAAAVPVRRLIVPEYLDRPTSRAYRKSLQLLSNPRASRPRLGTAREGGAPGGGGAARRPRARGERIGRTSRVEGGGARSACGPGSARASRRLLQSIVWVLGRGFPKESWYFHKQNKFTKKRYCMIDDVGQ